MRRYMMVATSLLANLVSNLATLLEFACGSAASAEQFVLEAGISSTIPAHLEHFVWNAPGGCRGSETKPAQVELESVRV
jgi:hypothetical protein